MADRLDTSLARILADYQVLYQKLRNYHWNVTGPMFFELHLKFEELYDDAALKVDGIAERLVARGERPPSTLKEQLDLARLSEPSGSSSAPDMVADLASDYEKLNAFLREGIGEAEEIGDRTSANLLDGFADGQEETIWMLRAYLAS